MRTLLLASVLSFLHLALVAQEAHVLTLVAIGDVGEANRILRGNAGTLADMLSGRHDGGKFQALVFLGDNFYNTGLNVAADDVQGKITSVLGPFREIFEALGRGAIYAIPGNHDYYSRNAIETSLLFGLVSIEEAPIGLANRGNQREAEIPSWIYHYGMPDQSLLAIPGGPDTLQLLFVDSALPLRTSPATWSGALDSLVRILSSSRGRPGIRWRVLCMHHPWWSFGKHGGYSIWNDETNQVDHLNNCDKDSNAVGWFLNSMDPEDLCTQKYRAYLDSLTSGIRRAGTKIDLVLSGHDHSLQLLFEESAPRSVLPHVQIISGAGSKPTRVHFPLPPAVYTSTDPDPKSEGLSRPGFVQMRFTPELLRVVFFDGMRAERLDMGGGKDEFWINHQGELVPPPKGLIR